MRISVFETGEKAEKIRGFYAQFDAAHWYLSEAAKRSDRYLLLHAASDSVLYGGRLILAHNDILFPYHKLFMTELEKAVTKPEGLMDIICALLDDPGPETARALLESIRGFRQWYDPPEPWNARFIKDTELAWMENRPYAGDW